MVRCYSENIKTLIWAACPPAQTLSRNWTFIGDACHTTQSSCLPQGSPSLLRNQRDTGPVTDVGICTEHCKHSYLYDHAAAVNVN